MFTPIRPDGISGKARWSLALALSTVALGVPAAAATAAGNTDAPANDNRADAISLTPLPQHIGGTTVGATAELNEPASGCAPTAGSVWYTLAVSSAPPDRIGVKLVANGNLDAAVDVYQQQRSQLLSVACRRTDQNGRTVLALRDFGLMLGPLTLVRLASVYDPPLKLGRR